MRADRRKIVAIESDIESADRDVNVGDAANLLGQALGKRNAAPANADQREILGTAAIFDDFVRQTAQEYGQFLRPRGVVFFLRRASRAQS